MPISLSIERNLSKSPRVSVIILNYNGLRYMGSGLKECVDSVLLSTYPNFEIIFVDNGSTDKSADYITANFPSEVRVISNSHNLGFSEGFNTGIRASKGKYVALLSNDMTVDQNWLKPIIELMELNAQIGLCGFKRLVADSRGTEKLLDGIGADLYLCGRCRGIGNHEIDKGQYDSNIDNMDFIGGAMVLRKKTLQQVGLLDPIFKVYSEDVDLCFRIRKGGYKTVYVHNAVIWHRGQVTLKGMDPNRLYLDYMGHQNRIRCNIIHFTLKRILATFLIDSIRFFTTRPRGKKILVKAYIFNLRSIAVTLNKRLAYGPSPPFGCKYPVVSFDFSNLHRRMYASLRSKLGRQKN